MTIRVIADEEACIASKQCAAVAPRVFDNDEDGIVIVRADSFSDDELEHAEFAVRVCPSSAIRIQHDA